MINTSTTESASMINTSTLETAPMIYANTVEESAWLQLTQHVSDDYSHQCYNWHMSVTATVLQLTCCQCWPVGTEGRKHTAWLRWHLAWSSVWTWVCRHKKHTFDQTRQNTANKRIHTVAATILIETQHNTNHQWFHPSHPLISCPWLNSESIWFHAHD